MKLAVMQPYFFPYLGYFQLIGAVDKFVFYDDVKFIKSGWINRNRLRLSAGVAYITVPVIRAGLSGNIVDVEIKRDDIWRRKLLASVRQSYSKAPHVTRVLKLIEEVLAYSEAGIAEVAKQSVVAVARYLRLRTGFVWSSARFGNEMLTGQARILDICCLESATSYHNLPGGRDLYDVDAFQKAGIELRFIEPEFHEYWQGGMPFESGLSILDALMWNDRSIVREFLAISRSS